MDLFFIDWIPMGRAAAFLSVFVALLLSAAGGNAFAEGRRVALVIGNSNYTYAGQLKNPANDAKDIADQLKKVGFDVIVQLNADRTHMAAAIEDFTSRIAGAEAALFYYAGHGVQISNRNWLIPIDVEVKASTQPRLSLLALDEIQEGIAGQRVGTKIFILDACRDNPFAGRAGARAASQSGLAPVTAGNATLIAFSTSPGEVALDGTGRNSPFAEALLKAIPKPGQELQRTMRSVKKDVIDTTGGQQSPWTSDNLAGDFFFVSLPSEPAVAPGEEQDWDLARETGNPATLQSFIYKYPNGKYAPLASAALTRATFQQMEELKKELQGQQQEIGWWDSVKDSKDPAMLKNYLRRFPNGIHAPQADALLKQWENEQRAEKAQQEATKLREEQAARERDLQRVEAERRALEDGAKKRAEEAKNAVEMKRLQEEKRAQELKLQEELKKAQDEVRLAKEAKEKAEAARIAAEKAREESRSEAKKEGEAAEDIAKKQQEAEKAREALKEAQRKKEQADKEAAERAAEAKKAEEERQAAEEAAKAKAKEAEARKAAEEAARAKALREAKDAEAKKAAEEAARKAAQEKKDAEARDQARLKQLKEEAQKKKDAEDAARKQQEANRRNLEQAERERKAKEAEEQNAIKQQQQRYKPKATTVEKPSRPAPRREPRYDAPRGGGGGGGGGAPIIHGL